MIKPRCCNCVCWSPKPKDLDWGDCLAHAPVAYGIPGENTATNLAMIWPRTHRNEGCFHDFLDSRDGSKR